MENKYFTPDIEDMHAGYECELLIYAKWEPNTIKPYTALKSVVKCIKDQVIRVPYLTKEQIEAEGWKLLSEDKYLQFIKPDYSISYVEKLHLLIVIALEEKQSDVKYSGTCKDINTFRKIIKLLGI
jgi:hypothetical protein